VEVEDQGLTRSCWMKQILIWVTGVGVMKVEDQDQGLTLCSMKQSLIWMTGKGALCRESW
jgi:hypothetical protein